MSDSDQSSIHSSDDEEIDLSEEIDQAMTLINTIQQSYDDAINTLSRIQTLNTNVIRYHDRSFDDILDDLHQKALQEIESTGQTSFGSSVIKIIDQIA